MQGFCPNCNINLADETNTIVTKESQIFKGHNVYCMCKHCGYVMVYNKDRDLIFSLDRFKDDKEILEEIYKLLSEAGNAEIELIAKENEEAERVEVTEEEVHHSCEGNCSSCSGCQPVMKDCVEDGDLIAVNKKTGDMSVVHQKHLDLINVDDFEFFELNKVIVERIVSYKIQRL